MSEWKLPLKSSLGSKIALVLAGCLVGVLALAFVTFLAAGIFAREWIPAKLNDMQLKDHMVELAQRYPRKESAFFAAQVLERAKELHMSIEAKDITVDKNADRVRFRVEYKESLSLIFTVVEWEFRHDIERFIFLL